jgi:hypothetical protein
MKRQEQFARWAKHECFKEQIAPAAVNIDFTRALGENVTKRIISPRPARQARGNAYRHHARRPKTRKFDRPNQAEILDSRH